jgi:uncharacterized membrane protein
MKIFGHPIHPLMIHFSTALLPMDVVMSFLYKATGKTMYYHCGYFCLLGAVLMGIPAIITGLLELPRLVHAHKQAVAAALYHGFLNSFIILVFGIFLWKSMKIFPAPVPVTFSLCVIKAVLIVLLFAGNYLGGKLIYKHHVIQ